MYSNIHFAEHAERERVTNVGWEKNNRIDPRRKRIGYMFSNTIAR